MMLAAMTIHKVDPPPGEFFKGVDLAGINNVVDDAGNHVDALHRARGLFQSLGGAGWGILQCRTGATASNWPSQSRSRFDPGGGLGSYNHPFAVAVREDVHPDHFSANALAVCRTRFNVTALHHGDVAQYFHVHGSEFDGLNFDRAALDTRDDLLFRELPAVVADLNPIVAQDAADQCAIPGLHGTGPVPFELLQSFRGARALSFWRVRKRSRIGESDRSDAYGQQRPHGLLHHCLFRPLVVR